MLKEINIIPTVTARKKRTITLSAVVSAGNEYPTMFNVDIIIKMTNTNNCDVCIHSSFLPGPNPPSPPFMIIL